MASDKGAKATGTRRNVARQSGILTKFGLLGTSAALLLVVGGMPHPALAQQEQDDIDEPVVPSRPAVTGGTASSALNAALVRLGRDPRNVSALLDAGQAALRMGDTQAALGFFTRADQVSPGNARIKMQIGSALVLANEPVDAVRYFDAAESANGDLAAFALDRGLAYDLLGDNRQAQGWYQVALSRGANEEATLRYAISLAISHDLRTAETLLAPLVQKQDRAAWRARTFALAINGDETQAASIARAMMPANLAEGIAPYLRYMPRLTRAQQAAAANLGRFPRAADIGHDDSKILAYAAAHPEIGRSLVPSGAPLGAVASAEDSRASRAKRRVPGRDEDSSRINRARSADNARIDADLSAEPAPKPKQKGKAAATPTPAPAPAQLSAPPPVYTAQQSVTPTPVVRSILDGPPVRSGPMRSNPAVVQRPAEVAPAPQSAPAVVAAAAPARALPAPPAATPTLSPAPAPRPTSPPPVTSAQTLAAATTPKAVPATNPALSATAPAPKAELALVALPPSTAAASGKPLPSPGFDLARMASTRPSPVSEPPTGSSRSPASTPVPVSAPAASTPSPAPPAPSPAAPPASDFGSAFGSFTPPPTERESAAPAVDLSKITPARRRPVKPAEVAAPVEPSGAVKGKAGKGKLAGKVGARGERPDGPVASRSGDDDEDTVTVARGAKAGVKGRKGVQAAEIEPKKGAKGKRAPANPSRIWIQLLTAPNRDLLPREWTRIVKAAPAQLRGKRPYVTPWGKNYRLLAGPYPSDDDAQDALNALTKAKVRGFVWTSPAGQAVDRLDDE